MAKQRIFSRATNLVGTTLDKAESVTYEGLTMVEMTAKSLTNTLEEFRNDSVNDLIDSRVSVMEKRKEAKIKLEELGYTPDEIELCLNFERLHTR